MLPGKLLGCSRQSFSNFNNGAPGAAEGRGRFRAPERSTLISAHPAGGVRAYQSATFDPDKRASAGGGDPIILLKPPAGGCALNRVRPPADARSTESNVPLC